MSYARDVRALYWRHKNCMAFSIVALLSYRIHKSCQFDHWAYICDEHNLIVCIWPFQMYHTKFRENTHSHTNTIENQVKIICTQIESEEIVCFASDIPMCMTIVYGILYSLCLNLFFSLHLYFILYIYVPFRGWAKTSVKWSMVFFTFQYFAIEFYSGGDGCRSERAT